MCAAASASAAATDGGAAALEAPGNSATCGLPSTAHSRCSLLRCERTGENRQRWQARQSAAPVELAAHLLLRSSLAARRLHVAVQLHDRSRPRRFFSRGGQRRRRHRDRERTPRSVERRPELLRHRRAHGRCAPGRGWPRRRAHAWSEQGARRERRSCRPLERHRRARAARGRQREADGRRRGPRRRALRRCREEQANLEVVADRRCGPVQLASAQRQALAGRGKRRVQPGAAHRLPAHARFSLELELDVAGCERSSRGRPSVQRVSPGARHACVQAPRQQLGGARGGAALPDAQHGRYRVSREPDACLRQPQRDCGRRIQPHPLGGKVAQQPLLTGQQREPAVWRASSRKRSQRSIRSRSESALNQVRAREDPAATHAVSAQQHQRRAACVGAQKVVGVLAERGERIQRRHSLVAAEGLHGAPEQLCVRRQALLHAGQVVQPVAPAVALPQEASNRRRRVARRCGRCASCGRGRWLGRREHDEPRCHVRQVQVKAVLRKPARASARNGGCSTVFAHLRRGLGGGAGGAAARRMLCQQRLQLAGRTTQTAEERAENAARQGHHGGRTARHARAFSARGAAGITGCGLLARECLEAHAR